MRKPYIAQAEIKTSNEIGGRGVTFVGTQSRLKPLAAIKRELVIFNSLRSDRRAARDVSRWQKEGKLPVTNPGKETMTIRRFQVTTEDHRLESMEDFLNS